MVDDRFFKRTKIGTIDQLCQNDEIKKLIINYDDLPSGFYISDVNVLSKATNSQLAFFTNKKYRNDYLSSDAGIIITSEKEAKNSDIESVIIISNDPYRLYALIADALYTDITLDTGVKTDYYEDDYGAKVHNSASLENGVITSHNVTIGANSIIGSGSKISSGSVIGSGVIIGRNCHIDSNVTLYNCLLGDNIYISAGAVIGSSGFGYAMGKTHVTVPQLGRVLIQDDVHIGAGTTIDRGAIEDTIIGEGSRIDNLVQIGHNVIIGRYCVIAGQTAIAGSVKFDDYVICGGQSCIAGHISLGSGSRLSGGAALMHDLPAGETWSGSPAKPLRTNFKEIATLSYLTKNRHLIKE